MGNDQSIMTQSQQLLGHPIWNSNYGNIFLLNKNQIVKQQFFHSKQEYLQYYENCQLIKSLNHQNIVKLDIVFSQKVNTLCSSIFQVRTSWEFYQTTLEDLLVQKKKLNGSYFNENQIMGLIFQTINALMCFSKNGIMHNYIQPTHMIISQTGEIKITDIQFMTNKNEYDIFLMNQQELIENNGEQFQEAIDLKESFNQPKCYLSPQLLKNLQQNLDQSNFPQNKSNFHILNDIFSLGIAVLELIFLNYDYSIYNLQNFTIDFQIIQQKLQKLAENKLYSQNLYDILKGMLEEKQDNRISYQALLEKTINFKDVLFLIVENLNNNCEQFNMKKRNYFNKSFSNFSAIAAQQLQNRKNLKIFDPIINNENSFSNQQQNELNNQVKISPQLNQSQDKSQTNDIFIKQQNVQVFNNNHNLYKTIALKEVEKATPTPTLKISNNYNSQQLPQFKIYSKTLNENSNMNLKKDQVYYSQRKTLKFDFGHIEKD